MSSRVALLAAVALAGGLIFFFSSRGDSGGDVMDLTALYGAGGGGQTANVSDSPAGAGAPSGSASGTAPAAHTPARRYSHQAPNFSFDLPMGFTAGAFKDESGETVLVRGPQDAEFQIYITPQDQDFTVTEERITQDVPDIAIRDAKTIRLAGAPGLLFASEDASLGATRELWFEYRRFLYQATSRASAGDAMIAIMGTWKFE